MGVGQWVILGVAVVAVLVAGLLWYWRSRVGSEMALMAATQTSNAADVASKAPGTVVELKGTLRGDALLTSEFAQRPCLYYRSLTEREVERHSTGSGGKRETRRSYETVTDVVRFSPAKLEDASGRVAIELEGAKVEGTQVHKRYESGSGAGMVAGVVGSLLNASGRTVGFRYSEWIVAADMPVYVLGTALGGGRVGKSTEKKQPFVVSIKSEEERTRSLKWTRLWLILGTLVAAVVAITLVVVAFASGPF